MSKITVYGIKTCDSVRKALKFFKANNIEIDFFDFKKQKVKLAQIESWLEKVEIDKLFNSRGTTYKTLKLKELDLDENGKKEYLARENMLIKRPVIEYEGDVIVSFNEEIYKDKFIK